MRRLRSRARVAEAIAREVEAEVALGRPADATLAGLFRGHPDYGSRDRRLYGDIVFACQRWRGWVGSVAEGGAVAMIWSHLLDAAAIHPVLERLAMDEGIPDPSPVEGHSLGARAECYARRRGLARIPDPLALVPAWLPSEFAPPDASASSRVQAVPAAADGPPGTDLLRAFVESAQSRPPLWLRAVGCSGAELVERLDEAGARATAPSALAQAICVAGHPPLAELERRIGTCFEVQDLSSQAVGAICDPAPGAAWWDVCAGGGGKALDLAARMGGRGQVLATDVRESALAELDRRRRRAGATIEIVRHDGRQARAEEFDGVLVDAPCSGVGTWGRNADARWRTTPDTVARAADAQLAILDRASAAVRPGGRLVYSVCTLTRRETVDVVARFLAARPGFGLDAQVHPLTGGETDGQVWIWPWLGPCGGMFAAGFSRRA